MKMTKLMIAAAIVCAAAFAQAASINWVANGNYVTSDGIVQTAATADVGTFVLVYLGNGTANWESATVVNEGTVTYASTKGTVSAKATGAYNFMHGAAGSPVNGDIFAVMFKDDKGNLSKLQSGGSAVDTTFTVSGLTENTWAQPFVFANGNFSSAPGATPPGPGGSEGIPEPTSGLLLLMGGALLALRRKQK